VEWPCGKKPNVGGGENAKGASTTRKRKAKRVRLSETELVGKRSGDAKGLDHRKNNEAKPEDVGNKVRRLPAQTPQRARRGGVKHWKEQARKEEVVCWETGKGQNRERKVRAPWRRSAPTGGSKNIGQARKEGEGGGWFKSVEWSWRGIWPEGVSTSPLQAW